jgi:hypothetical protein
MGIHLEPSGKLKFMNQEINDQERLANGGVYLINPSIVKALGYKSGEKISLEKDILKKLGYNKFYEHINFIKDKLGITPPHLARTRRY